MKVYGVRVIVRKGDKYLLVQHNQTPQYPGDVRDPEKRGLWSFPGGHFEGDESPEQAVVRELQEEFKLVVNQISYVGELSYKNKLYKVYSAKTDQEIIYFDEKEIEAYRWFSFEDVKDLTRSGLEHTGYEYSLLQSVHNS
ncbi:MAG: NUDIX hydrolase [Candidatus Saccharibacteria bacterium]|nr:NUDIX hydrolase [Candidatus Saccharibacteria bacterium]